MKKVKSIVFQVTLEGNGIVNYDSNDQKWVFKSIRDSGDLSLSYMNNIHDNVSYAKKNFYEENGKWSYKIKISSDCMKKDMFGEDLISQTPNIVHQDDIFYAYIASPLSLIRGYLFASRTATFKKKGALQLCDAEQTCGAVSMIETFSRSGEKITNAGDTDKADNTFYKKETIGEIHYKSQGFIDLMELQFIGCDQVFDRYAFNPDEFRRFQFYLKNRMPNFNSVLAYYQQNSSSVDIPEYGILLSSENVLFLVKETLKRLLKLNIKRKNAYAKLQTLKIKLVNDVFTDTLNSEENWIEIKTEQDINQLDFEVEQFYNVIDDAEAKEKRDQIESEIKRKKELDKELDKAKKDNKKKAKKDDE